MGERGQRIAAVVATAALLVGPAPAVALHAPAADQRTNAGAVEPDWMRALRIRSEALNRMHGLAGGQHGWERDSMRALQIRGEALNRMYGLDGGERAHEAAR
jgi:hypothetical protein